MKQIASLILISLFIACSKKDSSEFDWSNWDNMSDAKKLVLMDGVKDEFDYLQHEKGWKEKNAQYFHFFDLDNDGDLDLIYDGWSGSEPYCVRIYLYANKEYERVLDEYQYITDLRMNEKGLSAISIEDPGCCGSFIIFNMDYSVDQSADKMKFELIQRKARIDYTDLPQKKLNSPISFTVANENYHLRANPYIDTVNLLYPGGDGDGNILATYKQGARGIAVGEATDETGRVWWFVEMDPLYKPVSSWFYAVDSQPTKLTGWMSSRYLKVD